MVLANQFHALSEHPPLEGQKMENQLVVKPDHTVSNIVSFDAVYKPIF